MFLFSLRAILGIRFDKEKVHETVMKCFDMAESTVKFDRKYFSRVNAARI